VITTQPFHTPVFVLTHHPRPSLVMEGGTTFHFIDASPAAALQAARAAADGQDVRIGGGPTIVRDFLAAGLVDHLHLVVAPILLGRGVRLWDGLEGLEQDYAVEASSSPSGVTHVTFTRAGVERASVENLYHVPPLRLTGDAVTMRIHRCGSAGDGTCVTARGRRSSRARRP
jgi:dihydrofolate reductase